MPIYPMSGLKKFGLKKILGVATLGLTLLFPVGVYADAIQDINQMFRKGDLNGALARANQALAKNPRDAQLRFLKGLTLADLNRTSEAIQVFTSITDDYPELPEPYNNLAVLYASQGKYDSAKNALEMAIRTHPSYATAHENLGDLYAKMASQAYDKALQIDSGNKTAQTKLAFIKDMMAGQPRKVAPPKIANAATSTPASTNGAVAKPVVPKPAQASTSSKNSPAEVAEAWANAWSNKDVEGYLAFYSPEFTPSKGTYDEWAAQRRERISKAEQISVALSNITMQRVSADRAMVQFNQSYQSDKLKNTSRKTLEMVLANGKWLILRESGR